MPLSAPPDPLPRPNARDLPAGRLFHRVHLGRFGGIEFNPCRGGPTRFAPITDGEGRCVPSLYAGSTVEAAIFETLFHDIPPTARRKTFPRSALGMRAHSVFEPCRALRVAELRKPDLALWHVERTDLIASSPADYGQTARWAEALHRTFPDFDGMIWTSNQCDPDDALILFGDRLAAGDLKLIATYPSTDATFEAEVLRAAKRAGIVLTV